MGAVNRVLVLACVTALVFSSKASLGDDIVKDVRQLPTAYREDLGMQVAYLAEDLKQLDVFIGKLGPGDQSRDLRHLYEELVYVIEGRGHTLLWRAEDAEPVRLDWEAGDLLSPPLNYRHQHRNDSSTGEVVLLHVTTRPLSGLMFGDEFLSRAGYSFGSIWDEYYPIKEPEPTGYKTEAYDEMKGGFLVKDIDGRELPYNRPGHFGIAFLPFEGRNMAGNRLFELQIFDYLPPSESPYNRHPWEVVYYVLKGNGGGVFHMAGEEPDPLMFEQGDVFYERSNKWHWHGPIDGSEYRVIQIKASAWFRNTMEPESAYQRRDKPASLDEYIQRFLPE